MSADDILEDVRSVPFVKDAELPENIRTCLKLIRDLDTMPGDTLPNGETASFTAHEYVMHGRIKRCVYKHRRVHNARKRPYHFKTPKNK